MAKSVYIITDDCMWEKNKLEGTRAPHCIGVVNEKTGQIHYIMTGSRITVIDGKITQARTQEGYNSQKE